MQQQRQQRKKIIFFEYKAMNLKKAKNIAIPNLIHPLNLFYRWKK
jgi:hypothetical protein